MIIIMRNTRFLPTNLEDAGKKKSAAHIREMIDLTAKIGDCLSNALKEIDE